MVDVQLPAAAAPLVFILSVILVGAAVVAVVAAVAAVVGVTDEETSVPLTNHGIPHGESWSQMVWVSASET